MEVICLEEPAFYALLDKVYERIKKQEKIVVEKWITSEEAMKRLNISSKTTLQKYRDEGRIRFSQPEKKIILYDAESINSYLEDNTWGGA